MTNRTIGKLGAAVTGLAVLAFAVSMVVGLLTPAIFAACLSSIFIAIGFVPFMAAVAAHRRDDGRRATALTGMAFAVVYAVIVLLVYYAECTTVRMNGGLSGEVLSIISYGTLGSLFFNYDLLGYGFMALSTFFVGFCVAPERKGGRALRAMLWGHGVFFLPCLVVPMLPVFTPGANPVVGTVLLEVWCAYFLPVCILGWRYFAGQGDVDDANRGA